MKKLLFTLSLCSLLLVPAVQVSAQNSQTKLEKKELKEKRKEERKEEKEEHKKLEEIKFAQQNVASIESLNFSFYPNTIEPEFGVTNPIMGLGDYYFTVDKNVMYINMPYVGRFYITPMSPESVPINLTSTRFLYSVHTTDGINFHVTIVPTDLINILNQGIEFNFYLNKNSGFAKLVVTADNRQEITYTGTFN